MLMKRRGLVMKTPVVEFLCLNLRQEGQGDIINEKSVLLIGQSLKEYLLFCIYVKFVGKPDNIDTWSM